jgi:Rho-binding antiterminator
MTDYLPIGCADHDRLELAVMRRRRLRLTWLDEATKCEICENVYPMDVQTRDGAEWLRIQRENGGLTVLRLDSILVVNVL